MIAKKRRDCFGTREYCKTNGICKNCPVSIKCGETKYPKRRFFGRKKNE